MNEQIDRRGRGGAEPTAAADPGVPPKRLPFARSDDERRAYGRHDVEGVNGSFVFSTDARVVNISLDGMAVETDHYLQVGRMYSLKLATPGHTLPLRGKVVWCTLVRTARNEQREVVPIYRAGVHFEKILSEKASDLYRFIEQNAVISLEKRLFGRFKVQTREQANVRYEARFVVRRISLSGMSFETDTVPEVESLVTIDMDLDGRHFTATGRIVHVQRAREEADGPSVTVGLAFLDLTPGARRMLEEFIRETLG